MPLIEPVLQQRNCIHAGREIERGTHRAHAAKLSRPRHPEFSRHLQNQIAAHRISREKDLRQAIPFDEFKKNSSEIGAQPGVVERRRQPFRAAAIALIEAQHVKAAGKRPRRQSSHVRGFARTLEAVHYRQRRRSARLRLPVASRQ